VCHVPGPRGISLGYFCPSRAASQCFCQAPGHVAAMLQAVQTRMFTGLRRTPRCFSTPEAVLSEFPCYLSLVGIFQRSSWTESVSSKSEVKPTPRIGKKKGHLRVKYTSHRHLECVSARYPVALVIYLLFFDCDAMICEAYSESSVVQEMCAAPGVTICRRLE
jgi:hypothetical protein